MTVDERIELLKSNILHFTQGPAALRRRRDSPARPEDRQAGAAAGRRHDRRGRRAACCSPSRRTTASPASSPPPARATCAKTPRRSALPRRAQGANSSLTVPLILHDEVIGTFNVESPEPRAFTESDLQFLEIFTRDVAVALNTLELLAAEKASTAAASVEAIHSAVALPVDDILNDAVQRHGALHRPRARGRRAAAAHPAQRPRHQAGDPESRPEDGPGRGPAARRRRVERGPRCVGRRVLVVDADETRAQRRPRPARALRLHRRNGPRRRRSPVHGPQPRPTTSATTSIIADIRLPDMSGYELLLKLQGDASSRVPLVLMTGFGYDPGHSIVKARQAGLQAVLYKPFRLDQLLETVEQIVSNAPANASAS